VVEEAVAAGIDDVLIITSTAKKGLEDHFDRMADLEMLLEAKGKHDMLAQVRSIAELATFHFTRQGAPLGLGHAVMMAARHVGNEPFAVMLPDELLADNGETLGRMIDVAEQKGSSVVALREVGPDEISNYGCARPEAAGDGVMRITEIVEKPAPGLAPSNLAVVGRYVFTPDVFDRISRTPPGKGGEIQLTDAMAMLIEDPGLYGIVTESGSYDTGQKLDWLRANVELSLRDPDVGPQVEAMLETIMKARELT
jgi:UTP--glucose-1-phosphate uridylyltransferase